MIYWHEFDWPSFAALVGAIATLIVGIAAVRGASRVGLRQVAIAERQVSIQSRQVALEEASLKASLFERRMAIFENALSFLSDPHMLGSDYERPEDIRTFGRALEESRFLFHPRVFEALDEIWLKSQELQSLNFHLRLRAYAKLESELTQRRILDLTEWMASRLNTLHEAFAPDLDLSLKPST